MKKRHKIFKKAEEANAKCRDLRWGQCVFNAAYKLYPDIVQPLTGTKVDCFHVDGLVDDFLKSIELAGGEDE